MSDGQLEVAEGVVVGSADVLRVYLLDPLGLQPVADLEVGDHSGARTLRELDGVADVIAVAMGNEDVIHLVEVGCRVRRRGVSREEGIDEDEKAVDLEP